LTIYLPFQFWPDPRPTLDTNPIPNPKPDPNLKLKHSCKKT